MNVNNSKIRNTFEADLTVVFPKEKLRYEYSGIVQIENQELFLFIHYDADSRDISYLKQIQLFNRPTNDFFIQISKAGFIKDTICYTCFGCYCTTPFIHTTIGDLKQSFFLPMTDTGLIEVQCNSWIENAICEGSNEEIWKSVMMDMPFLENWADCDSGTYDFPINSDLSIKVQVGIIEKFKRFPPETSKVKSVKFYCESSTPQSIDELTSYAYRFFLFIRFATNIEIPQGKLSFVEEFEDFINHKDCPLHFKPTFQSESEIYPNINRIIDIPIHLRTLVNNPVSLQRWYDCCKKKQTSLALLARVLANEYYIDRQIIYLVQIFEGLQKEKASIVPRKKFAAWKKQVLNEAVRTAQEMELEELQVYKRLDGLLSYFNKPPLKNILSDFIDDNFNDERLYANVGGKAFFLEFVMIMRNGASHGNYVIPEEVGGNMLYAILELLKDIVRVYINRKILGLNRGCMP
jgi:hypothetical protein